MDAWDPDKPLPPEILARLLALTPIKEHLPGQHDQADHGKWASDSEGRNFNTDAENAVDAGLKIKSVTSGGDKELTIRRYGAATTSANEMTKASSRLGDLWRSNKKQEEEIIATLKPALTRLMANTPFAGGEESWVMGATAGDIQTVIEQGLTDPVEIAAAKSILEIRATKRALEAIGGILQSAPENPDSMSGRPDGLFTYLIEDVDGKITGIAQYRLDQDLSNIHVEKVVELGVAPGTVTMAVGAAMKLASANNWSVTFPATYISARATETPNGADPGVFGWQKKLDEIGATAFEPTPEQAKGTRGSYMIQSEVAKDWVQVALEDVPASFGLPSEWKRDPAKPFDPPPSEYDTIKQHQKMVQQFKASPTKAQKLSLEEISTVQKWQSMDWRGINQAAAIMSENPVDGLRGSDLEGSDLDIIVEELDSIAARNSAEEDWILWRGVSAPGLKGNPGADPRREAGMIAAIRGAGEGGIIESGKFVSMTTDEDVARTFADDRMLRISVPAATKGFWIENLVAANPDLPKFLNEKEFVTARGTKYRVDKIVEDHPDYGFYAELTVVP